MYIVVDESSIRKTKTSYGKWVVDYCEVYPSHKIHLYCFAFTKTELLAKIANMKQLNLPTKDWRIA